METHHVRETMKSEGAGGMAVDDPAEEQLKFKIKVWEQRFYDLQTKYETLEKKLVMSKGCGENQKAVQKNGEDRQNEEQSELRNMESMVTEAITRTKIVADEDLVIPAKTEVLCLGRLKRRLGGEVLVCEPKGLDMENIQVAWLVVNYTPTIPVRILNASQEDFKILKGQQLGVAVKAEEIFVDGGKKQVIGTLDVSKDKWIQEGFDLEHLDKEIRGKMMDLLRSYADLFREEGDILTSTTKVKHGITLEPEATPICKAPYRIPYKQREVLQKEIDRLLQA